MKDFYHAIVFLLFSSFISAQIINIPDPRFKEMVVNEIVANYDGSSGFSNTVDTNNDGEIQVSEAEAVIGLYIGNVSNDDKISNLEGLQYFTNLQYLSVQDNEITTIDTTPFTDLETLYVSNNLLTSLDLSSNANLSIMSCQFNQISNFVGSPSIEELFCDVNQIADLDVSANTNLSRLGCAGNLLTTLDLSNNTNLTQIVCGENLLTNLDLTNNVNLVELSSGGNQLSSLDVSTLVNLTLLWCSYNQITSLDISNNLTLENLICSHNLITSLDISSNQTLTRFDYQDNPELIYLNEKNGVPTLAEFGTNNYNGSDCPNLEYICADGEEVNQLASYHSALNFGFSNVSSYCSFVPGGEFYTISGSHTLDINANGCDPGDSLYPNLKLEITDGNTSGTVISDDTGDYTTYVQSGIHTITPILENPSYFNVTPSIFTVDFLTDSSPYTQDFCITPNGVHNDLEVVIIPIELARPGFDTDYKIVYKNKGNTTLSGNIDLSFDDDFMDFLVSIPSASNQTLGNLSWDFTDLLPFETREVLYTMTLNTPTDGSFPLNGGDIIEYTATLNYGNTDETPEDNNFILSQEIVNSYDPNDKRCLEGNSIALSQVGEYVHYLIRFENTGTASAVNVVVKDFLESSKFDISTVVPLDASHSYYTRVLNENEVEFVFENIQLPFNDEDNDGYVLFKIKSLATLDLGDSFSNIAGIYFDFNAPIITNIETTTVENNLSIDDLNTIDIVVHPNPTSDYFTIGHQETLNIKSVDLFDISGKKVRQYSASASYNTQDLSPGIYFIKIKTDQAEINNRIIKN